MTITKEGSKARGRKVKEQGALFEVQETGRYLPVHDKSAALDATFRDSDIKHGLTIFAKHELNQLDLWERNGKFYVHCIKRLDKRLAKAEVERMIEEA